MVSAALTVGLLQVGILFAVAGLAKSLARTRFRAELAVHGLLPLWARRLTARYLPAAELLLGVWLVSGVRFRLAAASASVLLAAFVLYRIALRMAGPSDASCGCLGEAKSR